MNLYAIFFICEINATVYYMTTKLDCETISKWKGIGKIWCENMKIVQKFAISKITSRLQATFSYVNQKILIKEK